ncbi:P25 protein [Smittium culicis]|uniref:p25 protein n=1 Tax=Smittium culicis TaxID=133412 RepID=A0A1R1XAV3_9FUNG|nr:P25 protein [Smittium culicis]
MSDKPLIYIIYYSMYGHIATLGDAIKKGLEKNNNVNVEVYQVPETLSQDVLEKMGAPPKRDDPIIDIKNLPKADGYLFGVPTRFGFMPAQFKSFWDSTGSLWFSGELQGKFAGMFFSTSSQSGGQETTAWTHLPVFVHHQISFVPLGYGDAFPLLSKSDEVVGGSPYGAGTITGGDGKRMPSPTELQIAEIQGESFARILSKYKSSPADALTSTATATTSSDPAPHAAATTTTAADASVSATKAPAAASTAADVPASSSSAAHENSSAAPELNTKPSDSSVAKQGKMKKFLKRISKLF